MKNTLKTLFLVILAGVFAPGLAIAATPGSENVVAGRGWDMGACRIPKDDVNTLHVYFVDGENVNMPVHINKLNNSPDVRDIYIVGNPVFPYMVEMGESRYTSDGNDKYADVMQCFSGGISFDVPDSNISNEADIPVNDFFPQAADNLRQALLQNKAHGLTLEFRNLCNRKAELILIQNYADNTKDEFIVRICAHAQKIARRNGQVIHQDEYVTPFEQYVTMGRLDNQWKLKEILSPAAGESALSRENLDQDSSFQQAQWYYQHSRAV